MCRGCFFWRCGMACPLSGAARAVGRCEIIAANKRFANGLFTMASCIGLTGDVRVTMSYQQNCVITKAAGLLAMLAFAAPLGATVRDGVDAWSRGDYAAAVAEWQGPAAAGDPDAMFNMGQAYRLGRGVPEDFERAEQLYLAAAQAGHVQAADTYGLMLFQDGRRDRSVALCPGRLAQGRPACAIPDRYRPFQRRPGRSRLGAGLCPADLGEWCRFAAGGTGDPADG